MPAPHGNGAAPLPPACAAAAAPCSRPSRPPVRRPATAAGRTPINGPLPGGCQAASPARRAAQPAGPGRSTGTSKGRRQVQPAQSSASPNQVTAAEVSRGDTRQVRPARPGDRRPGQPAVSRPARARRFPAARTSTSPPVSRSPAGTTRSPRANTSHCGAMLTALISDHPGRAFACFLDIPFDETPARHQARDAQLRRGRDAPVIPRPGPAARRNRAGHPGRIITRGHRERGSGRHRARRLTARGQQHPPGQQPGRYFRCLAGARPGPRTGHPPGHSPLPRPLPLLLPPLVFLAAARCARRAKPPALGEPGLRSAADCTREAARPVMGVLPLPALFAPVPFPLPLLLMVPSPHGPCLAFFVPGASGPQRRVAARYRQASRAHDRQQGLRLPLPVTAPRHAARHFREPGNGYGASPTPGVPFHANASHSAIQI
jgi:hypothetical protein